MREAGATVVTRQGDVSDERDVASLLELIRSQLPPLRGVVHSAGVLADATILNQTWDRFSETLGPKVTGAWHLSYNFTDSSERSDRRYIPPAMQFLREGIAVKDFVEPDKVR